METINYEKYFKIDQQVRILIHRRDKKPLDKNAEITSIQGDTVYVEILGDKLPEHEFHGIANAKVSFSGGSEWGLQRCNAVLEDIIDAKHVRLKLTGEVLEQQRREYFRFDVCLPLLWAKTEDQHLKAATAQWVVDRNNLLNQQPPRMFPSGNGYKVVKWRGGDDLMPQDVNLSGGGMRIKTTEFTAPGTMLSVDLFLPLAPPRAIRVVTQIIRCSEVILSWEKGTSYITAMKFVCIDEKDRESIINYIFCEQRNKLQSEIDKRG